MKLGDSSDSSFVIEVNRENKVSSKKNFSFRVCKNLKVYFSAKNYSWCFAVYRRG